MRYVYPFYKEERDDSRQVGLLLPFLGGVLLGGVISPYNKNQGYYPQYQYPQYPNTYYQNYPSYNNTYYPYYYPYY